jgi:hypothetical protein
VAWVPIAAVVPVTVLVTDALLPSSRLHSALLPTIPLSLQFNPFFTAKNHKKARVGPDDGPFAKSTGSQIDSRNGALVSPLSSH